MKCKTSMAGMARGGGDFYSLRCHLRQVLGPVNPSEWMECFFRCPRSTFFHHRTSVCLFLFQIHSIILNCCKHSSTFQEPNIQFSTPVRITKCHYPLLNTCPLPAPPCFPSLLIENTHGSRKDLLLSLFPLNEEEFRLL